MKRIEDGRGRPAGDDESGVFAEQVRDDASLKDVVLDSSNSLMSAAPDEFDTKVRWILESIAEHIDADRGYVYRAHEETHELLYAWSSDERPHDITETLPASVEATGPLFESLAEFESVHAPRLQSIGPDDSGVRNGSGWQSETALGAALVGADVRSLVAVPMVVDWELHGCLAFDTVAREADWDAPTVHTLQTAGDMLAHSLRQVRRERELERQNERLEEFASVISHDLRNPLNVAKGRVELAQETGDTGHLAAAATAHERMSAIIEDVLAMAQQGKVLGVEDLEPVELSDVAERSWETVSTADATLQVETALTVVAHPTRLRQVFENLFRNAVEHGPDDVSIRVGSTPGVDGFFVADDGPGIPASEQDCVLNVGYTTSDEGTGLGLNIVQDIVTAHGWTLSLTESETGGARVEISDVDRLATPVAPA
jgi:signal transduction histidine kinase